MTTHKDTTMLGRLTEIVCERRINDAYERCPIVCDAMPCRCAEDTARAILNELKHPSEGMIAAMLSKFEREHWNVEYRNGVLEQYRASFTAAMDFVLNEGEGNTTS